ncbi:MAG: amino acid adenylation domain-containing protein [Acidimicrobiales bacterium]
MTETHIAMPSRHSLSPIQRALYASQQRDPRSPMQNMASVVHIDGPVDHDRLAAAFAQVVAAHDVLRTRVIASGAEATSVQLSAEPASTETMDLPRDDVGEWAARRIADVIDVAERVFDSVLLRHEDDSTTWYLALHHCVTDAAASTQIFRETAEAYVGHSPTPDSYYDWVRRLSRPDERIARARSHWSERRLAPRFGHLYARNRPPTASSTRVPVEFDADFRRSLEAHLSGRFRLLTPDLAWTALLLTATAALLHRITGAVEFDIGVPVHNRSAPQARTLVGPLVEVFPVGVEIDADDTFATLHHRVARSLASTLANASPGTAPHGANIEAIVNVVPAADIQEFAGIPATFGYVHSGAADRTHLLRVQLFRFGAPELALDVNQAAADESATERAPAHFLRVLEALVDRPDDRLDEMPVLTADEAATMTRWGDAAGPDSDPPLVVARLRDALDGSTRVALVDGERSWTGDDLWRTVTAVAASLRAQGVTSGTRVAIEMERSADAVIAIYAVLVAGGSYVPIDPAQPDTRRQRLIERAECVLTLRSLPEIDETRFEDPEVTETDECYLLYTSGSTGEPKGVPITHRGLADYLAFAIDHYVQRDEDLVVPLFSALTFDLTVTSLFVATATSGRLVVLRGDGPAVVAAIAADTDFTWCKATPSHLEILDRLLPDEHGLTTLVVGGEAFLAPLANRLRSKLPGVHIFNEYGPTEAVVGCMIYEATGDSHRSSPEVPIGRPAPGVRLRVVDEAFHPVPVGAPGELLISHRGMTTGYLDADPSAFMEIDETRWYRSGDLVRMLDDETLVYLRRIDEQLKVGGIRLDPSEIEAALVSHPLIRRAAVRPWSPTHRPANRHCVRCGLADNVPGVSFDDSGTCDRCRDYDAVRDQAESWFRTPDDLIALRDEARRSRRGDYDCIALLSGGKDSTYVLYQLVKMGFDVHALTLDNGFISDEAKENVRRSIDHLGVSHEFATTDAMNAIFRDSLDRFSNVCQGCFKTIYTVATNRAVELGAPLVVTGLSRGQLFETRLTPAQFAESRFDPAAIDEAVLAARKAYHRTDDAVTRLLDTEIFETDDVFEAVSYVDFYRYLDVELSEMLRFLEEEAPWVRPSDTGRSTNCRINAAGIQTHLHEQGYHNYAEPYAWDVRLGHKQRDEALAELDDRDDVAEVAAILADVDYRPRRREVLTAWAELENDTAPPTPTELRTHLQSLLPAYAIPDAFVFVPELAMTANGKLDIEKLPAPERSHRSSPGMVLAPASPLERTIVSIWERQLGIEPISVDDDYFALGGDSLGAIEMAMLLTDELDVDVPDSVVFANAVPRRLAEAISAFLQDGTTEAGPQPATAGSPPPLSDGEQSLLYEARLHPVDPRYNQGRTYRIHGVVDVDRIHRAIERVAARHQPLHWTHASPRVRLTPTAAVDFRADEPGTTEEAERSAAALHRAPFDLERGPLLRAQLGQLTDTESPTAILTIATHHVSTDEGSFDRLWSEIATAYSGDDLPQLPISYADHTTWQRRRAPEAARAFWLEHAAGGARLPIMRPTRHEPDGLRQRPTTLRADELRAAAGASPFATVLAAVGLALRRIDGRRPPSVGALVSTRDHAAATDLIGYYLNTLPIEVPVSDELTLAQLRTACASRLAEAMTHRSYPFARIVADQRDVGRPDPTPQVLVTLQELGALRLGEVPVEQEILYSGSAVADATIFVQVRDDRVELAIEHRATVIDAAMADFLLAEAEAALTAIVRAPKQTVAEWRSRGTNDHVLHGDPAPTSTHVLDAFRAHVAARPDAIAVRLKDTTTSRLDLDLWSDHIAGRLIADGIRPGDRVAMAVRRSAAAVASIVGILKAGAAYVPIDLDYPSDRNREILDGAGVAMVLVARPDAEQAVLVGHPQVVIDLAPSESLEPGNALPPTSLDDTAYVIHTSGSTGTPRGVAVDHRRLAVSTAVRGPVYRDDPDDFLLLSSFAFDSSVAGLFWALSTGATLTLPTTTQAHDVDELVDLFTGGSTHTLLVPTLYRAVLSRAGEGGAWPRQVIVAGEATTSELIDAHRRTHPESRLTNEYGPTEATVWATAAHLDATSSGVVPIGTPLPGTWAAVIDADAQPCPPGVVGELVLGGALVTDGYDGLDSDRFLDSSPLGPGRAFLTGDLAAHVGGQIYFLGRFDDQLNVGGVRLEPGEIEAALESVEGVEATVVVAQDPRSLQVRLADADAASLRSAFDHASGSVDPLSEVFAALEDPSRQAVVAHVEPGEVRPDIAALRTAARDRLPASSRPVRYFLHDALPRTPSGKIDRRAVTRIAIEEPAPSAPPPATTIFDDPELTELVHLHRRALERRTDDLAGFGPDTDFFDAGGDSLAALELLQLVESRYGITLRVSVLFEARTPRALHRTLGLSGEAPATHDDLVVIRPGTEASAPLWLLPGAGGVLLVFERIVAALDPDLRVLGLDYPGTRGERSPLTTVEELGEYYTDAMRRAQPQGPYRMLGYSLGGLVAVDIARRLHEDGEVVEFLGAIEAGLADAADPRSRREIYRDTYADEGLRGITRRVREKLSGRLRRAPEKASRRLRTIVEGAAISRFGLRPSDRFLFIRMLAVSRAAGLRYRPPRISSRVTLFVGADATDQWRQAMTTSWSEVAGAGLDVLTVPGSHLDNAMLTDPAAARALAADVSKALR